MSKQSKTRSEPAYMHSPPSEDIRGTQCTPEPGTCAEPNSRKGMEPRPYVPDPCDRKILDIIQTGFPLEVRPYARIGELVGISEEEAYNRIRNMRESGHIRRIGANFDSLKLGFTSTLCAAKVPECKLAEFIREVNSHTEVTHNYLRNHAYNVWFTIIAQDMNAVCRIIEDLARKTGIMALNLPATALYKIRVDFPLEREENNENANTGL